MKVSGIHFESWERENPKDYLFDHHSSNYLYFVDV